MCLLSKYNLIRLNQLVLISAEANGGITLHVVLPNAFRAGRARFKDGLPDLDGRNVHGLGGAGSLDVGHSLALHTQVALGTSNFKGHNLPERGLTVDDYTPLLTYLAKPETWSAPNFVSGVECILQVGRQYLANSQVGQLALRDLQSLVYAGVGGREPGLNDELDVGELELVVRVDLATPIGGPVVEVAHVPKVVLDKGGVVTDLNFTDGLGHTESAVVISPNISIQRLVQRRLAGGVSLTAPVSSDDAWRASTSSTKRFTTIHATSLRATLSIHEATQPSSCFVCSISHRCESGCACGKSLGNSVGFGPRSVSSSKCCEGECSGKQCTTD